MEPAKILRDFYISGNLTVTGNLLNEQEEEIFSKYTEVIGDGLSESFEIEHNLGTRDLSVTIREANSPYSVVSGIIKMTTENKIEVSFTEAPEENKYTVIIIG